MTVRRARRRARTTALVVLAVILTATVALPSFANHYQASLEGSFFEIDDDANLRLDSPSGFDDWASVDEARKADAPSGKTDDSYTGGAKEDDACPSVGTGSIPPNKSDLLNFGLYEEPGSPGFLHLFWHRVQEPSGTTLMDFELNQSSTDCGNGVNPVRTVGDLLIEYRIDQGGARAAIFVREWEGSAWGAEADFTDLAATGTINSTAIPASEADGLGDISARTFGEASIDLSFIFDETECLSFGSAMLKSRSSTSFTSALKDFIAPVPIELSNCGTVTVEKTDDAGAGLDGAEFTLYLDDGNGSFDTASDEEVGTCTTSGGATTTPAECTFTDVLAGDYWIDETLVPAGHEKDEDLPHFFSVAADQDVVLAFTNPRNRGSILVEKEDHNGDPLDGAEFTIDAGTEDAIVMTEVDAGLFCTDGLLFDTYTVSETVTPPGYDTASEQDFTVDAPSTCDDRVGDDPDLTFTNDPTPGTVEVLKVDDDGVLLEGVTFELYADDGTGTPTGDLLGSCETDASGTCPIGSVDPGDYCVVEAGGVPAGYETDSDPQCFEVEITADGDVIELTFTNAQLHKVVVIVCHEGTATLAASDASLGGVDLTTLGVGAALQDELCALDGFGDLGHGEVQVSVDVGSDAH